MLDPLSRLPLGDIPLLAYARARSAYFAVQYLAVSQLAPRGERVDVETVLRAIASRDALLRADVANIHAGLYPAEVMRPEPLGDHLGRLPRLLGDLVSSTLRFRAGQTAVFSPSAAEYLDGVPPYFRRNFHHQTDGYLSEASAELYDHQVEMLFGGAADAMRRLIIPSMKAAFAGSDGKGLVFLEIAAGTGRATRFVRLAFPRARIVVSDLSPPYLTVARRRLASFSRLDFVEADGSDLPFRDETFDACYSVFMFHEIPASIRRKVLGQARRILKPGGFIGGVDSLQSGDEAAFDALLQSFSSAYHEPFYQNYLDDDLEGLWEEAGFSLTGRGYGFLSKWVSGKR